MSETILRPFQKEVFQAIKQGHSVVLQAPTGAGKTRAALYPYIHELINSVESNPAYSAKAVLPWTCRYNVPMRVLAQQFFAEYHSILDKLSSHKLNKITALYQNVLKKPAVAIQTGEQPDDPLFESLLTFCTIDQLLASFLSIPYSVGKRRANMNVGAVVGSYLVFDEFHLYPLRSKADVFGARTTTMTMLRILNYKNPPLNPFVLMTATFSSTLLHELAKCLGATCIRVQGDELDLLNQGRQRIFQVYERPMTALDVLDTHKHASLVVCNTRLDAQRMYLELKHVLEHTTTELILLHSNFTDADRKQYQNRIISMLGKEQWNKDTGAPINADLDVIVVATQVVEVGLDISVEQLHTVVAPASSVIQRAGRCARFAYQHGTVHIYPTAPDDQGKISYLPYANEICEATLAACAVFNQRHVGFEQEQQIIDEVHTPEDTVLLEQFTRHDDQIKQKIFEGWANVDRGVAPELIRDVQQVSFIVHHDPDNSIQEQPWRYETFGMYTYSLAGIWPRLAEAAAQQAEWDEEAFFAWEAQAEDLLDEPAERMQTRYKWAPVSDFNKAQRALVLALSPRIATYDHHLGLVLNDGRLAWPWPAEEYRSKEIKTATRAYDPVQYEQETFGEHVQGLLKAYQYSYLSNMLAWVTYRLEQRFELEQGSIDQALRLAFACHDIGKLGSGWQNWCEGWQQLLVEHYPHEAARFTPHKRPWAHTDYEPFMAELQRSFNKTNHRPHHACESVWLARYVIGMAFGLDKQSDAGKSGLVKAIFAAMARHHAPTSEAYQSIKLVPQAAEAIVEALTIVKQQHPETIIQRLETHIAQAGDLRNFMTYANHKSSDLEVLIYFVLVRYLRLCDNRSFIRDW